MSHMLELGVSMRDIALLVVLSGLVWLAWLRPWVGVLGLSFLSYMHPQGYSSGFVNVFPVYATLFAVVCASLVYGLWRRRMVITSLVPFARDWRVWMLTSLWLWFGITTFFSVAPWEAWDKYLQVLKIAPPLLLTLLLINDRRKLHYLIITIALSIVLVAFKGGYWAVMTGFHDRVYGPPGSQYGDNNEFAVAVCMAIPLMVIWLHATSNRFLKGVIVVGIALCYGAALSSWSRGGLLALGVVTLLLIWHSRRKLWVLPLLTVLGVALFVQLPDEWFGRMQSLGNPTDASAQSRLAAWRIGWDVISQRPVTGAGFNAWPAYTLSTGGPLDWHSMYVEMATEHGIVGLVLWGILLLGSVFVLTLQAWRRLPNQQRWVADYSAMLQTSLAAYLVGGLTLGIAYWELPYHLVSVSILLKTIAREDIPRVRNAGTKPMEGDLVVSEDLTLASR